MCWAVQITWRHFFVNPIFTTFQMQITSKSHFRYLIDSLSNQMVRITWRFICQKRHSIHLKWVPKLIEQVLQMMAHMPIAMIFWKSSPRWLRICACWVDTRPQTDFLRWKFWNFSLFGPKTIPKSHFLWAEPTQPCLIDFFW